MLDCMTPVSVGAPKVWKVKFLLTLYCTSITVYELLQDIAVARTISVE